MRHTWDPADNRDTDVIYWRGQLFPVIRGGAEDSGDGDGTPPGDGDGTPPADGGSSGEQDKTFTQDQVNALVTREVQKAARGKLDPKELGFESGKELKEFLDQVKEEHEAAKGEEEKALEEAIAQAKGLAREEVLIPAENLMLKAHFMLAAADSGVTKATVEDAFLLARSMPEWDDVSVGEDGTVSGLDEGFFTALKEAKPYLFASEGGPPPTPGIKPGAGGGPPDPASKAKALAEKYPALARLGVGQG